MLRNLNEEKEDRMKKKGLQRIFFVSKFKYEKKWMYLPKQFFTNTNTYIVYNKNLNFYYIYYTCFDRGIRQVDLHYTNNCLLLAIVFYNYNTFTCHIKRPIRSSQWDLLAHRYNCDYFYWMQNRSVRSELSPFKEPHE